MALQTCTLNLDRSRRELSPHGTIEFPCAGYFSTYTDQAGDEVPWHYHDEVELVYADRGSMKVQVPGRTFLLHPEQCLFINSGILHFAIAEKECDLKSLVFSTDLIAGSSQSVFARRYVEPLIRSRYPDACYLSSQNADFDFQTVFQAILSEETGYEFLVREQLSHMWLQLYRQYEPSFTDILVIPSPDDLRIRRMLDYIHTNYRENMDLTEIAQAADIGERECLRCFRRMIQISPIQYLIKYRVMQGASLLLSSPQRSVAEISIDCGFDSPSHFTSLFHRFLGCTPREYRHRTE